MTRIDPEELKVLQTRAKRVGLATAIIARGGLGAALFLLVFWPAFTGDHGAITRTMIVAFAMLGAPSAMGKAPSSSTG